MPTTTQHHQSMQLQFSKEAGKHLTSTFPGGSLTSVTLGEVDSQVCGTRPPSQLVSQEAETRGPTIWAQALETMGLKWASSSALESVIALDPVSKKCWKKRIKM